MLGVVGVGSCTVQTHIPNHFWERNKPVSLLSQLGQAGVKTATGADCFREEQSMWEGLWYKDLGLILLPTVLALQDSL